MDELIDKILLEEFKLVNKHLPRRRVSICDLVNMEIPYIVTGDGGIHIFDPREIEILAKVSEHNCSLKLPIIIEFIPQHEGIYVIRDPLEAEVVSKILGITKNTPLILYRSILLELRKKLRTTSTILITPGILM
ncbi:MAG: DUF61 family protein [Desulfurococcaceae archaeon]